LIGATGIEDKLQEGVPQCIEDLRRAGIKIWVLTGDKLETAINIGYASNLLDGAMKLWTVRGGDTADKVLQSLNEISEQLDKIQDEQDESEPARENALVIEGSALVHIFESSEAKESLLNIAIRCKSVVCCRVSPLQKALVVQLVRKYHNVVTLAIGDGANDVSMIQVANVGVGIAGQEGVQAAMAADYAIGQFRFLHKLLLVQGHWSYARVSEMILTFFFKNVFWVFPSLWYQIYSAWSGNIFYDYSFLQLYNIIFTVAPVVILGKTFSPA
jgi:phospholipid-translocating ATPase